MPWSPPDHQIQLTLTYDDFSAQVEISGSYSLYALAELLIDAMGFNFDHAFGFYDNLSNHYRSSERYTLFADMGDPEDGEPGVEDTLVRDVFTEGKRMLFYFDYGDDWRFPLTCDKIQQRSLKKRVKRILSRSGTPPVQYPELDED